MFWFYFLGNCRENGKGIKEISCWIGKKNKEDLKSSGDIFIFFFFGDILNDILNFLWNMNDLVVVFKINELRGYLVSECV